MLVNAWCGTGVKEATAPWAQPTSKMALFLVVAVNAAAIAPQAKEISGDLPLLIPGIAVVIVVSYVLGWASGLFFHDRGLTIALTYSTGMRNISLGLVLGLAYFDAKAVVPVIITTLIQQPAAAAVNWLFAKFSGHDQFRYDRYESRSH
ncbi:MAG TPA: hypothetical protein VF260_08460, partial [Bacilli bacterium]